MPIPGCICPIPREVLDVIYDWHYGYGFGWGTLSLLNAGLAQVQGRSGLMWFVLSIFLGPTKVPGAKV